MQRSYRRLWCAQVDEHGSAWILPTAGCHVTVSGNSIRLESFRVVGRYVFNWTLINPHSADMQASEHHPRFVQPRLIEALSNTPVALIHGPRQCGKTTLARAVGHSTAMLTSALTMTCAYRSLNPSDRFRGGFARQGHPRRSAARAPAVHLLTSPKLMRVFSNWV